MKKPSPILVVAVLLGCRSQAPVSNATPTETPSPAPGVSEEESDEEANDAQVTTPALALADELNRIARIVAHQCRPEPDRALSAEEWGACTASKIPVHGVYLGHSEECRGNLRKRLRQLECEELKEGCDSNPNQTEPVPPCEEPYEDSLSLWLMLVTASHYPHLPETLEFPPQEAPPSPDPIERLSGGRTRMNPTNPVCYPAQHAYARVLNECSPQAPGPECASRMMEPTAALGALFLEGTPCLLIGE